MPSSRPKSLVVLPQELFNRLQDDAEKKQKTIQALIREIVAAHYEVEAPNLSWGRIGESWGNALQKLPRWSAKREKDV